MTTPDPTLDNIAKVKDNLRRMQAFNDYVYNHGYAYVGNCYALLAKQDSNDPGLPVGVKLLESSFSDLASSLGGTTGEISAAVMCHVVNKWFDVTPPSLAQTFASMLIRYEQSSRQFDQDLSVYIDDPEAHWTDDFSWNGYACVLGDLATITFPAEGDAAFYPAAASSLKQLDRCIWQTVMQANCVVTYYYQGSCTVTMSDKTDMNSWAQSFIAKNPSYRVTWQYQPKSGFMQPAHYDVQESNVGFGASKYNDNAISSAACAYLFLDSTDGTVINPNGLMPRSVVFTGWGLRTAAIYYPPAGVVLP